MNNHNTGLCLVMLWRQWGTQWQGKKYLRYRKIPKHKPRGLYFSKGLFEGLIFGGAYIRRGLSAEGNLRFKINWANPIVRSKFTIFALFYFVLIWGQFSKYKPPGGLYLEGWFNGGFFALRVWGACIWRVLYMEGLIFGILQYPNEISSHETWH